MASDVINSRFNNYFYSLSLADWQIAIRPDSNVHFLLSSSQFRVAPAEEGQHEGDEGAQEERGRGRVPHAVNGGLRVPRPRQMVVPIGQMAQISPAKKKR